MCVMKDIIYYFFMFAGFWFLGLLLFDILILLDNCFSQGLCLPKRKGSILFDCLVA